MITDGYTEHHVFMDDECHLLVDLRPMLQPEREEFGTRVLNYPEPVGTGMACEVMAEHVVAWNRERISAAGMFDLKHESEDVWAELLRAVMGDPLIETADRDNLLRGVQLEIAYPRLANVDCRFCQKYWHDPLSGQTYRRGGEPVHRPADAPLLCQTHQGCPKGTPEDPQTLSLKNRAAFEFHRLCSAVRIWPDDPIVKRNALVIGEALQKGAKRGSP